MAAKAGARPGSKLRGLLLAVAAVVGVGCAALAEEKPDAALLAVSPGATQKGESDAWGRERLVLKIPRPSRERWAAVIESSARQEALPAGFLEKLLTRESGFFPFAVSRAGAQGIAQFMPKTASGRALDDPFDAARAIPAAARYVADLRRRFGNLGLAAAAYNAGPRRVSDWLAGAGGLPAETVAYVRAITGREAIDWLSPEQRATVATPSAGAAAETTRTSSRPMSLAKRSVGRKPSPEAMLCASLASSGKSCIVQDAY